MTDAHELCLGCGARVPTLEGPTHRYMLAAPGCWERYGALLNVLAGAPARREALQYCVDAYAAQHPGTPNPQAIQSVAVHLLNAYGYLELGRPVTVPQFAGHKGAFTWLEPPSFAGRLTVLDVPVDASDQLLLETSRAWMRSVWNAWSPHRGQIERWYALYASPSRGH